jgi:hypothetical protein
MHCHNLLSLCDPVSRSICTNICNVTNIYAILCDEYTRRKSDMQEVVLNISTFNFEYTLLIEYCNV